MLALTSGNATSLLPLPQAQTPLNIRAAVLSDLSFVDSLQRKHSRAVGWMPTAQLEGIIKQGKVLIAVAAGGTEQIGYCIGQDRYFKRDDVGIIYQMNVLPGKQRGLIGANLLKAQFERSAYGCKLYCCWCAQDLAANKFWEAMGFVALAFRTGGTGCAGKGKVRMHIFWQKRIRKGDEATPWWFPSETSSGAIRANRIVLPIPPGTHWSDAKPIVLPEMDMNGAAAEALPGPKVPRVKKPKAPVISPNAIRMGGLRYGAAAVAAEQKAAKPEPKPKVKMKNDPRLVAAARELKDRWLEQVNGGMYLPMANGKYEVSREIGAREPTGAPLLLPSAIAA